MTNPHPATVGELARLEIRCPGCDTREFIDARTDALAAYRAGEATEPEAFPNHSVDEQTLIECGWHPDCWDNAAHAHHP